MSLTVSAADVLLTVSKDGPNNGHGERKWGDQTHETRDLYTQFVISFALGLGAFITFCVCDWTLKSYLSPSNS